LAAVAGPLPCAVALALAGAILAYDLLLKRWGAVGALALGTCRFLNMGLGLALARVGVAEPFAAIPLYVVAFGVYVTALALVGLGEERGLPSGLFIAGGAAMLALAAACAVATPAPLVALLVLVPVGFPIVSGLIRSSFPRVGERDVRDLVREGVLAIPGIDVAILAGHSRWAAAAAVIAIALGARLLARRLPVA